MVTATAPPPAPRTDPATAQHATNVITSRVYARVGLLGNPSDGYNGQTISFALANFWAEVTLRPGPPGVSFVPHAEHDATQFPSLAALSRHVQTRGYYGGVRLLMSLCKRFFEHCQAGGVALDQHGGFSLSYDTNIPRQAGLSGSSAIITAALNCLLQHYQLPDAALPVAQRPSLVLSAEAELGITAGLQDRVIQVYGGLVAMDFEPQHLAATGAGRYDSLDPALLPRLWLVYCDNPSDSGGVHSTVKQRWLAGEPDVVAGMRDVARCAAEGRDALQRRDTAALAALMDRNFDLRRRMFGDAALGATNLAMVATARAVGAAAKFTGSGGAIVALCPSGEAQEAALQAACKAAGYECVLAQVAPALHHASPAAEAAGPPPE